MPWPSRSPKHIHHAPRVVARIYDPERAEVYRQLGINVVNPTTILDRLVREAAFAEDEPKQAAT